MCQLDNCIDNLYCIDLPPALAGGIKSAKEKGFSQTIRFG